MGNGLGISTHQQIISSSKQYLHLEKLSKTSYFYENPQEYLEAVTLAIETNSLDCLELLIISGNIKNIMPLHLAAKIGKLEPMELLISAGFPLDGVNKEGRIPLHACAFSSSKEIPLVVALLCLSHSSSSSSLMKAMKRYDYEGYTPIHLAIVEDNLPVLDAFLKNSDNKSNKKNPPPGINSDLLGIRTQNGKSLTQLAKDKKSFKCVEYLQETEKQFQFEKQKQKISQQKSHKGSSLSPPSSSSVSTDRIMEVWERFFENAFKSAGVDMEYGDDVVTRLEEKEYLVPTVRNEKDYYNEDWFEWFVQYDEDSNDYYVIHLYSLEKRWLSNHLTELARRKNYPFLFENYEFIAQWAFPTSIPEVISSGWLTFYDQLENYCSWINVKTYVYEYYLPLPIGEPVDRLAEYHLYPSWEHPDWCEADQTIPNAWVMVLYENEEEGGYSMYYLNSLTQETSWNAPNRWESMILNWDGWIPCCMEKNAQQTFW